MAICCDCTSEGKQYIVQQYTECCDAIACLCSGRSGCFYIEASTSTTPNYQTGLFYYSNQWVEESGCYYTGKTPNWSINIFPPHFSGGYKSLGGNGTYVNDSSGSGWWQIYNVTEDWSYDRGPKPAYPSYTASTSGCGTKPYYNLRGTGWKSDDESVYTFSIGNCCMTGACIQEAYARCYYYYTEIGRYTTWTTPWGGTSPKGVTIYDSGNIRLGLEDCTWYGYGMGSTSAELSYYEDADYPYNGNSGWHLFVEDDVANYYELFAIDGVGDPIVLSDCTSNLANTIWTTDTGSTLPPMDGAYVELGVCDPSVD